MKPEDKARAAATQALGGVQDWCPFKVGISVPDRGNVQFAADGSAFVELTLHVPAEVLR